MVDFYWNFYDAKSRDTHENISVDIGAAIFTLPLPSFAQNHRMRLAHQQKQTLILVQ